MLRPIYVLVVFRILGEQRHDFKFGMLLKFIIKLASQISNKFKFWADIARGTTNARYFN